MTKIKEFTKTFTFWLVLINIVVYIAILINPSLIYYLWSYNLLYNSPVEIWRFVTPVFTHAQLWHLVANLLSLIYLGDLVEKYCTKIEYLFVYLGTGIISEIATTIAYSLFAPDAVGFGASGAIYGLMGFFITTIVDDKKDRIKILIAVIISAIAVNLFISNIGNVAHFAGLISGLMFGLIFTKYCKHEKMNQFLKEYMVDVMLKVDSKKKFVNKPLK